MAEKSTYVLSKKPKIIEIDLRSSENGDVEVPRRTGGGSLRILPNTIEESVLNLIRRLMYVLRDER